MTFRLRIPGRNEASLRIAAKRANPLLKTSHLSELAEVAAEPVLISATVEESGIAEIADIAPTPDQIHTLRIARIAELGYGKHGDTLATALNARDHGLDDRRLCVECAHAGSNFHCARQEGFLLKQLRRCHSFEEFFSLKATNSTGHLI